MLSLWCYPWTLAEEGVDDAFETFADVGVEAINIASHYHSVRSLQPRFPESQFVQYPGGCYFDPGPARFQGTPIDPMQNTVEPFDDPLLAISNAGHRHDMDVNGWVVLCHNSRLGRANPDFRLESAFGDPQDHAFCPSHPAVRAYFTAVVGATAARNVDEIQLESLGFRSVLHGHGADFGHDKRQIELSSTAETLLSQCFCDGCHAAAASHAVSLDRAESVVQGLLRDVFDGSATPLPPLDDLVVEYPVLHDLFAYRADIVEQLTAELAEAAGDTPLNYYVMDGLGFDAEDVWPAGIRLSKLDTYLDRVTALCYVGDPDKARQRVRGIEAAVDCPVDVGLSFDPEFIPSFRDLDAVVNAIRPSGDRRLHLYHYSLMTKEHLEWVSQIS